MCYIHTPTSNLLVNLIKVANPQQEICSPSIVQGYLYLIPINTIYNINTILLCLICAIMTCIRIEKKIN